jgi:hypothetical protein
MLLRTFGLASAAILFVLPVREGAAFLPVYGSPGYAPGVGGYIVSVGTVDFIYNRIAVNDAGTAIGSADRFDSSGSRIDQRTVRWSATNSTELDHLATPGGVAYSRPTGINNSEVAIGAATDSSGTTRPVRWDGPGTAATLVQTPAGFSGATLVDINSSGSILGIGSLGGGTRPVRWSPTGIPNPLAELTGYSNTEAYDINDNGAVVGRAFNGFNDRAVRWDASGTITELGHLGLSGEGTTTVFPSALNSAGTAVGYAFKHDAQGIYQGTVPVRWDASGAAAIELETGPTSTGMRFGDARAINDDGVVVGYANNPPSSPTDEIGPRAARWTSSGTAVTLLGTLGTAPNGEGLSDALAINSSGLIVGTATKFNAANELSEFRAVYWRDDVEPIDLNSLIDPESGWLLTHAYAVSDTGWIAGDGLFDPDGPGGQDAYGRHFLLQLPDSTGPDFNNDGTVDAADYVVWRQTDGTPDGYNSWRSNFGQTVGGIGSSTNDIFVDAYSVVPESSAMIHYLAAAMAGLLGRRGLQLRNYRTNEMLK